MRWRARVEWSLREWVTLFFKVKAVKQRDLQSADYVLSIEVVFHHKLAYSQILGTLVFFWPGSAFIVDNPYQQTIRDPRSIRHPNGLAEAIIRLAN